MRLGYSCPLEATDLYKPQDHRASGVITEKVATSFEKRQRSAAEYNTRLANSEISPDLKGVWWSIKGQRQERMEREDGQEESQSHTRRQRQRLLVLVERWYLAPQASFPTFPSSPVLFSSR
jgi:hypothetical protein